MDWFIQHLGLPIDASANGIEIDRLIGWMHLMMLVLFVGWIAFFLYTIFRFHRSRHPRADHEGVKTHTSSYIEVTVAVLEIVLLVGLSIPFWSRKVSAFPTEADKPVLVRVVAQQFAWNIHYPGPDGVFGPSNIKLVSDPNPIGLDRKDPHGQDDVVKINQLHLPVNRPAIIEITTKDVIHSFAVPLLRVKQDAIPGMDIPIHFTPTQTSEQIRDQMVETVTLPARRPLELYATTQEYKAADGTLVVKKGGRLTTLTVKKLIDNGITQLAIAPASPVEIACAQLCGLTHYRMKGFLTIHPQAEFDTWYADEVENQKEE